MLRLFTLPVRRYLSTKSNAQGAVTLENFERLITLQLSANKSHDAKLRFPIAWLRDNCQCNKCYNASSDLRNLKMMDYNPRLNAVSAKLGSEGLTVSWEDGHISTFKLDWLRSLVFNKGAANQQKLPSSRHQALLWCDTKQTPFTQPERISFVDLMQDDASLLRALLELEQRGLVLLENCGLDPAAIKDLCQRIAFPRTTHYGETFEMKTEAKPRNLGYTTDRLDFHTDLPYLFEQPGVQALLCIKQASGPGGDSLFADGFSAAELVRQRQPDVFRILTSVPVRYRDRARGDHQFDLIASHPTIELEKQEGGLEDGGACKYRRVHFSNQQRDRIQTWPLANVQSVYDALKVFSDTIEGRSGDAVQLQVKLQPGEMVLFDNSRLLHSRVAFSGERHLAGAYMLWDEVLSCRRVLENYPD